MHSAPPASTPLDRTYKETMTLLIEARNYMAYGEPRQLKGLGPNANLKVSCEDFRITARLTQVLAWLLIRKAVQHEEMTAEDAAQDRYRLGGAEICLDDSAGQDEALPAALRDLLARSLRLYQRVGRL
ncbi:MAG: DUF1465 family protein, partial [Rhodospirillales bacterium]|nr:DUF1465 family protein [Rhodospirillales bacterium]